VPSAGAQRRQRVQRSWFLSSAVRPLVP